MTETAMMNGYGTGFGAMWMGMGLFWLLLIAAIVWLVVELTHTRRPDSIPAPPAAVGPLPGGPSAGSPMDVLDHRLATGQIDVAAYREARAALLESRGGQP
jgi:uncharacterized membrane protein